jgi:AmmeMemoRadiSam system protein A
MSAVVFAGVSPHPPIIVPEIGGRHLKEVEATVRGVREMMRRLVAARPEVVVIISPHAPLDPHSFSAYSGPRLRGDFWEFGAPQVEFDVPNHIVLLSRVAAVAHERGLPMWLVPAGRRLDHGTMVPLYYLLQAGWRSSVMVVGLSLRPFEDHVRFGECIAEAAAHLGVRLAVCASGDMSHRLKPGAPAGYHPEAHRYDEAIVEAIRAGDFERLLRLDPALREQAGEDIYRSLLIAYGALGRRLHRPEVFSYEGPFGVGYMAAVLADYSDLVGGGEVSEESIGESDLPALARRAVRAYVTEGRVLDPPPRLREGAAERAGVFVSIKTRQGQLRGCIGTIEPIRENVACEVIHNAIAAATRDPRFEPVRADELDELVFSVDILSPPEPVADPSALDPRRYGVVVETEDGRRGVLLPDLPGVETVERQLHYARAKAGIGPDEPIRISRFTVRRIRERAADGRG